MNTSDITTRAVTFKNQINPVFIWSTLLLIIIFYCGLMKTAIANETTQKNIVSNSWEEVGGVKFLSIRTTAAGYMLDFRYKVLEPKKAALLINRKNKPFLKVLKNGLVLKVPNTAKIGPLRQTSLLAKKDKNYFMFFGNPGRMVKSGDKVQIQIGDFTSKIIVVE